LEEHCSVLTRISHPCHQIVTFIRLNIDNEFNQEVRMNCHRCGSTMIFKEFCDYGGYSYGWKCILCGEIIEQIQEGCQWLKIGREQNKVGRRHSVMTYRDGLGFEWDGM